MTSSSTRATVTSSPSSFRRSILSRLKSPLQSKTRNFADFYIEANDPHRQYSPGDIISGSVILNVLKPLRITHLVISLHGYAQVFKNPNSPGDAYRNYSTTVASGSGKKGGSYYGNGFASLFEDEVVLCGEGRLGEGMYHFNFELEFPSTGLPSSIDFERGTISYMLTSTLTRPTTISPTTSCDTKVYLTDTIDIAPIPQPKPRVITLEPISRRARTKSSTRKLSARTEHIPAKSSIESTEPPPNARVSELHGGVEERNGPQSPAPSDASNDSQLSSGNASGTEYGIRSINTTVQDRSRDSVKATFEDKTITAAVEVLKGGFLRGDQVPIKITVKHTKHVRSLKGVIITLYRQARVDMHPALPVLPNSKGDKTKSEDYYPKSRTGLGGLSLSSAGSSHLFRKDLSQSFAPLFVDPRTLAAEVKCVVRVPDEAFPTIANVPGAMISFKYFVEVVVDIQGKLTGLDRMIPNSGLVSVPAAPGVASAMGRTEDGGSNMFSTWGGNFVDTDSLRREKGVISCVFEVVIGTKDSARSAKRKQPAVEPGTEVQADVPGASQETHDASDTMHGADQDYYGYDQGDQYYDHYAYDDTYQGEYDDTPAYREASTSEPPYQLPQNPEGEEEEVSEKERLRRAEARLLPSRPPDTAGPSLTRGIAPSAPVIPEDGEPYPQYFPVASSSSYQPPPFSVASQSSAPHPPEASHPQPPVTDNGTRTSPTSSSLTISAAAQQSPPIENAQSHPPGPLPIRHRESAPQYYPPSSSSHIHPADDKQELQRRRLEMERSSPPPEHADEDAPSASAPPATGLQNTSIAPSAPILEDEDEGLVGPAGPSSSAGDHNSGRPTDRSEDLPVYQR